MRTRARHDDDGRGELPGFGQTCPPTDADARIFFFCPSFFIIFVDPKQKILPFFVIHLFCNNAGGGRDCYDVVAFWIPRGSNGLGVEAM